MPIRGEYTWSESTDRLKVDVPLKGVSPKIVDIFVTSGVLKVNYSPYLLEIYLLKEVDPVKHKATVSNGVLHINLLKKVAEHWGSLEISLEEYERDLKKKELLKKKQDAYEQRRQLEEKIAADATERKVAEERQAVRSQMALDEEQRNRLEQLKLEEKQAAEAEVYKTFAQMQSAAVTGKKVTVASGEKEVEKLLESYDMIDDMADDEVLSPQKKATSTVLSSIAEEKKGTPETEDDDDDEDLEDEPGEHEDSLFDREVIETAADDIKYIPPPRNSVSTDITNPSTAANDGKVRINFTPRLFPTPMRESKAAEEEDWIAKNRRHLKKHGVLGKNLKSSSQRKISEEDPVWLKAKGDDFFRAHDLRSALNAYSAAIDCYDIDFTIFTNPTEDSSPQLPTLDANLIACLSNRSLCYLRLQLSKECQLDCDIVLKMYTLREEELIKQIHTIPIAHSTGEEASHPMVMERMKLLLNMIKMYLRRGLVFCQLGQYNLSLSDYSQGLVKLQLLTSYYRQQLESQYHITMESIQQDILRLKILLQAEQKKREGDIYFAEKKIVEAIQAYSMAIEKLPIYISAYSNRSACYLLQQEYTLSIQDCDYALAFLTLSSEEKIEDPASENSVVTTSTTTTSLPIINFVKTPESSTSHQIITSNSTTFIRTMLHSVIPLPQSEKHQQWYLNISLKKAVALIQLQEYLEAIQLYESLLQLYPTNESLKTDLENLYRQQQQREPQNGQLPPESPAKIEPTTTTTATATTDLDEVE